MYCYVSENGSEAERLVREVLSPALRRSETELSERLLFGPPEVCAQKLAAYQAAGVQRIFLWPVTDERRQIDLLAKHVLPMG